MCAGKQIPYSEIQSMIEDKSIVVRWDSFQLSPYFDYQGQDGKDYQVSLGFLSTRSVCVYYGTCSCFLLTTFTYPTRVVGKGRREKKGSSLDLLAELPSSKGILMCSKWVACDWRPLTSICTMSCVRVQCSPESIRIPWGYLDSRLLLILILLLLLSLDACQCRMIYVHGWLSW